MRFWFSLSLALGLASGACASSGGHRDGHRGGEPGAQVELLARGVAPYTAWRYRPEVGKPETVLYRTKLESRQGTREQPSAWEAWPVVRFEAERRATHIADDGEIVTQFVVLGATLEEDAAFPLELQVALSRSIASLVGLEGKGVLSPTGALVRYELMGEIPEDGLVEILAQGLVGALLQVAVVFPEESVGVEGRWRASAQPREAWGMRQSHLVTLEGHEGGRLRLSARTEYRIPQRYIKEGGEERWVRLEGSAESTFVVSPEQLSPLYALIQQELETEVISASGLRHYSWLRSETDYGPP